MRNISPQNVTDYLRGTGLVAPGERLAATELSGGVSNLVLLVERDGANEAQDRDQPLPPRFILKQARPQLRVPQPWFCGVERNEREVDMLRACGEVLAVRDPHGPVAEIPRVLFHDPTEHLFIMSAAPAEHVVWKSELLAGHFDHDIAALCGRTLGRLVAGSFRDDRFQAALGDRSFFDALRLDPYYRQLATVHHELAAPLGDLIAETNAANLSLVHADFSPKNLLVFGDNPRRVMLVDFETGHVGDPAFDWGFFASHLLLKSIYHRQRRPEVTSLLLAFCDHYRQAAQPTIGDEPFAAIEARSIRHAAACCLARIDGKSPVDYLPHADQQDQARCLARELLASRPCHWNALLSA